MRLLVSGRGATAKYKNVRGPTGENYARWQRERRARLLSRYGLDETNALKVVTGEHRRRMRNARKQERRAAR